MKVGVTDDNKSGWIFIILQNTGISTSFVKPGEHVLVQNTIEAHRLGEGDLAKAVGEIYRR